MILNEYRGIRAQPVNGPAVIKLGYVEFTAEYCDLYICDNTSFPDEIVTGFFKVEGDQIVYVEKGAV